MRFLGWYNVAYGWDFDNVILLELPDYETIDKLEGDPRSRAIGHRAGRVDVRAPPRHVPARADGSRPGVHPVSRSSRRTALPDRVPSRQPAPARTPRSAPHHRAVAGDHRSLARRTTMTDHDPASSARSPWRQASSAPPSSTTPADQLQRFLKTNKRAHPRGRRHGAARRRPGLPLRRAGPLVPLPHPGARTRRPASGRRDRGHREPVGDSSSCTTRPSLYALVRRGGTRAGRPAGRAHRGPGPAGGSRHLGRGGVGVGIGGSDPYIGAADEWAAGQDDAPPADATEAARRLYDLALTFQSRSQLSEARLVEQFEIAAAPSSGVLGDLLHARRRGRAGLVQGPGLVRGRGHPRARGGRSDRGHLEAARVARGRWSSSTTRPTCSATSPRRSRSSSRASIQTSSREKAEEGA